MSKQKHKSYLLSVAGLEVPVKIYKERRNSIRASLAKEHAILRLPLFISKKAEEEQIDRFYFWLKDKVLSKEKFRIQFQSKNYKDGYSFSLYDKEFTVNFEESLNKNHSAKYFKNNIIRIKLANGSTIKESELAITRLISRVIAQHYIKDITNRVLLINAKYFNKEIKSVNLKYNKSNWGSCSSSQNINLSTRLLFAPLEVQDYVIVHELSHLIQMNHSSKFWEIVEKFVPNYKLHEKWLNKNGYLCDFGI